MQLTTVIKETFSDDTWTTFLSEGRIAKAKHLYNERMENNEALSLLDSTQLCDKGSVIKKSETLRKKFRV